MTADQIIVAAEVTQDCNDLKQLHPMLELARENLTKAGGERGVVADVYDAQPYA